MEFNSNKSIYLQICDSIYEKILCGELQPDERIPSVREYGAEIGVNPNTIQKAYRQLEDEGLIESHSGAKSYMVLDSRQIETVREELIEDDATGIVERLKDMGLSKADALALIDKYWN